MMSLLMEEGLRSAVRTKTGLKAFMRAAAVTWILSTAFYLGFSLGYPTMSYTERFQFEWVDMVISKLVPLCTPIP